MATTEWRIWADVRNAEDGDGTIGTRVGTAVAAGVGGSLMWWLDKAGIEVDAPPTSGQGWPR